MAENNASFVRHELIKEQVPPVSERGLVKCQGKSGFVTI